MQTKADRGRRRPSLQWHFPTVAPSAARVTSPPQVLQPQPLVQSCFPHVRRPAVARERSQRIRSASAEAAPRKQSCKPLSICRAGTAQGISERGMWPLSRACLDRAHRLRSTLKCQRVARLWQPTGPASSELSHGKSAPGTIPRAYLGPARCCAACCIPATAPAPRSSLPCSRGLACSRGPDRPSALGARRSALGAGRARQGTVAARQSSLRGGRDLAARAAPYRAAQLADAARCAARRTLALATATTACLCARAAACSRAGMWSPPRCHLTPSRACTVAWHGMPRG